MISYDQALARMIACGEQRRLPIERLPIERALGRILAEPVLARVDVPGFDNSAMDGFAIMAADAVVGARLVETGVQWAGIDQGLHLLPGQAIRITTGAPLPVGTEVVVPKEIVEMDGTEVLIRQASPRGAHLRRRGEDVGVGDCIADRGERLDATRLAALAVAGVDAVNVFRLPRVAVVTTGDELRNPGETLQPGQIYDSNRHYLLAALREAGFDPTAWPALPDRREALQSALLQLSEVFDVVLCCGGVSAGERDLLPGLLAELGDVLLHKVRMKPGMPFLLATVGQALVSGLPGNPVSVLATFQQLVLPMLNALRGAPSAPLRIAARLEAPLLKQHGRLEFVRGLAHVDGCGQWRVQPHAATGSHRLVAASECNCLIVLGEGEADHAVDEVVPICPWRFPA